MKKRVLIFATLLMILTMFADITGKGPVDQNIFKAPVAEANIAGFSPHAVDMHTYNNRWTNFGQNKNTTYTSGNHLIYDIYNHGNGRAGGNIENRNLGRGTQPYYTFEGWSAIVGHMHHTTTNQKTHILAVNRATKQEKIYNTYPRPGDATKDIEYNKRASTPTSIYNACSSTRRNVDPLTCNMWYPGVGFKAFIPMNELFPEGVESGSEWELYIVKRVGDRVVYDELKLPFEMNDLRHGEGRVSFDSGVDASQLTMVSTHVLRYPRKGVSPPHGTYFTMGNKYWMSSMDQSGTAVWYGVTSPHDNWGTRWNASTYWQFGGNIATLKYISDTETCPDGSIQVEGEECPLNVIINHKDIDTGAQLGREQFKIRVGDSYRYTNKPAGYFTKEDSEYKPAPPEQGFNGIAKHENLTFTFTYKLENEPPEDGIQPGTQVGSSGGDVSWRLYKPNSNEKSQIKAENLQVITRDHYAVRSGSIWNTTTGASFSRKTDGPHTVTGINADAERDGTITYKFEYSYTNHYKYVCSSWGEDGCSSWSKVPDWSKEVFYVNEETLLVDHERGDEFDLGVNGSIKQLTIGRSKDTGSGATHHQQEAFTLPIGGRDRGHKTQVAIPIMENPYRYSNDFNEGFHHIDKDVVENNYWAFEVDKNLQDKYRNTTSRNYQPYAIPVQIGNVQKVGSEHIIPIVSKDDFYTTRATGFVFSVPKGTSKGNVNSTVATEYKNFTGANYRDEVVEVNDTLKSSYYMPIDGNGEMREKTKYTHPLVIGRMGFNDVTMKHDIETYFEHYLVGSVFDETWVVEQNDPIINTETYPYSVNITQEDGNKIKELGRTDYIHGYRSTDGVEFYDKLRTILDLTDF